MKKFWLFIGKLMLSASAAVGMACVGMQWEWRFEFILAAFLFVGIFVALALRIFDIEEPTTKHENIKNAARSMRPAA